MLKTVVCQLSPIFSTMATPLGADSSVRTYSATSLSRRRSAKREEFASSNSRAMKASSASLGSCAPRGVSWPAGTVEGMRQATFQLVRDLTPDLRGRRLSSPSVTYDGEAIFLGMPPGPPTSRESYVIPEDHPQGPGRGLFPWALYPEQVGNERFSGDLVEAHRGQDFCARNLPERAKVSKSPRAVGATRDHDDRGTFRARGGRLGALPGREYGSCCRKESWARRGILPEAASGSVGCTGRAAQPLAM